MYRAPHGQERRHFVLCIFALPVTFPYLLGRSRTVLNLSATLFRREISLMKSKTRRIMRNRTYVEDIFSLFLKKKNIFNRQFNDFDNHRRRQKCKKE